MGFNPVHLARDAAIEGWDGRSVRDIVQALAESESDQHILLNPVIGTAEHPFRSITIIAPKHYPPLSCGRAIAPPSPHIVLHAVSHPAPTVAEWVFPGIRSGAHHRIDANEGGQCNQGHACKCHRHSARSRNASLRHHCLPLMSPFIIQFPPGSYVSTLR